MLGNILISAVTPIETDDGWALASRIFAKSM